VLAAVLLRKSNSTTPARFFSASLILLSLVMSTKLVRLPDSNVANYAGELLERAFAFHFITAESLHAPWRIVTYVLWAFGLLAIPMSFYLIFRKTRESLLCVCLYLVAVALIVIVTFTPALFVSSGRLSFVSNMLLVILILVLLRHNGLSRTFVLPVVALGVLKILMFYLCWQSRGFHVFFGHLDVTEIPFIVRGM